MSSTLVATSTNSNEMPLASAVKLMPSDAPESPITVSTEVANMSVTIRNMLEDFGGATDISIPVHNVDTKTLRKVIEYCEYHIANPTPMGPAPAYTGPPKKDDIAPWDKEFCSVDNVTLFDLILAANYLDIRPLIDVTCTTVANMIKGKTPDEIRVIFEIKENPTPEEQEQIRKDNAWCEEQ